MMIPALVSLSCLLPASCFGLGVLGCYVKVYSLISSMGVSVPVLLSQRYQSMVGWLSPITCRRVDVRWQALVGSGHITHHSNTT